MMRFFVTLLIALSLSWPALAWNPDEVLENQALEDRARSISKELRCLVCQNQSIDDSDAPLARDLRLIVRERLVAGDSDTAIYDFVVARYGEFVLLRPRLNIGTVILWSSPVLVILGGVYLIGRRQRNQTDRLETATILNADEEKALKKLLDKS